GGPSVRGIEGGRDPALTSAGVAGQVLGPEATDHLGGQVPAESAQGDTPDMRTDSGEPAGQPEAGVAVDTPPGEVWRRLKWWVAVVLMVLATGYASWHVISTVDRVNQTERRVAALESELRMKAGELAALKSELRMKAGELAALESRMQMKVGESETR